MYPSLASFWSHDIWHPLGGPGYQFWSGIGSDIQELEILVTVVVSIIAVWRIYRRVKPHLECHVEDCRRIGLHHVHGTHFRTCWEHHPVLSLHPHRRVPLHVIHNAHRDAMAGAVRIKEGNH